jgi:hypothetical protein
MNSPTAPDTSARTPSVRRTWAAPVVVNLALGIVAVIPVWALVLFAVNYPLAGLGITHREPTENDGMLPWLLVLVPVWAAFLGLWIPVNLAMRRKRDAAKRRYWTASSLLVLLPTVALMFFIGNK